MGRARGPTYRVPFRRRREGKTDYRRRLKLLYSKGNRIVVRTSNKHVRMQLVAMDNNGDRTLIDANSRELAAYGYAGGGSNSSAAYLTGLLFAMRSKAAGFEAAILDIGLKTPIRGSNVYAALKGAIDCGMSIPHDPGIFPSDDRIEGAHISSFLNLDSFVNSCKKVKEAILSEKKVKTDTEVQVERV